MSERIELPDDWFARPVPPNVVMGTRSWLYSAYAFLHFHSTRPCGVRIGHDSGVYFETFFDLGPDGEVEIGDYCTLAGPIFATNGRVEIGDYVLISREVVIADSPAPVPPRSRDRSARQAVRSEAIVIGDDAWIGTRALLLPGARIGIGAIVGAAAVVDFAVPDYAIVAGNPARVVGWARPQEESMNNTGAIPL
jgi:acetyltransferase-like isoleucine patch superfamily enzyme